MQTCSSLCTRSLESNPEGLVKAKGTANTRANWVDYFFPPLVFLTAGAGAALQRDQVSSQVYSQLPLCEGGPSDERAGARDGVGGSRGGDGQMRAGSRTRAHTHKALDRVLALQTNGTSSAHVSNGSRLRRRSADHFQRERRRAASKFTSSGIRFVFFFSPLAGWISDQS